MNKAEGSAGERQQHALRQQLPDDAAAAGADCRPNGDLAPPPRRAHQQKICDIGARNEQHERNGAGQDEKGLPHVADERFLKRRDAEALVLVESARELPLEIRRRAIELRLRLLERHTRLETACRIEVVTLIFRVGIELKRRPDVARPH